MASQVREREALIMEAIFNNHPAFVTQTANPIKSYDTSGKAASKVATWLLHVKIFSLVELADEPAARALMHFCSILKQNLALNTLFAGIALYTGIVYSSRYGVHIPG